MVQVVEVKWEGLEEDMVEECGSWELDGLLVVVT